MAELSDLKNEINLLGLGDHLCCIYNNVAERSEGWLDKPGQPPK